MLRPRVPGWGVTTLPGGARRIEPLTFDCFARAWFLRIKPKYLFTIDGEQPCDAALVGPYSTSLKADEHNSQVLNHVLFWADVLSLRRPIIELALDGRIVMQIEKTPLSGMAHFAIPEDPAAYEENSPSTPQSLFDVIVDDAAEDSDNA
jgi:hypothetical protein